MVQKVISTKDMQASCKVKKKGYSLLFSQLNYCISATNDKLSLRITNFSCWKGETMRWLLLAFLIVPAMEIGIFIWAGGIIGPWWVVAIILFTGIAGISIAKVQGMETWKRAQHSMNQGIMPGNEIIDGICIFMGAVFLFTPGFITDTAGFILVLPFTRRPFKRVLQRFIKNRMDKGTIIYRKW